MNVITSSIAAMGSNAGVSIGSAGAYDILFTLSALLSITQTKVVQGGRGIKPGCRKERNKAVYNDIRMAVSTFT